MQYLVRSGVWALEMFTLLEIEHRSPYWQFSGSGVLSSYIWVLGFKSASWRTHTLGTFPKHPCSGPPSTPSGDLPLIWHSVHPFTPSLSIIMLPTTFNVNVVWKCCYESRTQRSSHSQQNSVIVFLIRRNTAILHPLTAHVVVPCRVVATTTTSSCRDRIEHSRMIN